MEIDRLAFRSACGCLAALCLAAAAVGGVQAQSAQKPAPVDVKVGVISRRVPPPTLYEVDPIPTDEAIAGARLAIADNNTTGAFTRQRYTLEEAIPAEGQSPADLAKRMIDGGDRFLVANLDADDLLAVADAVKESGALVFNVGATDDRLRGADCRPNLYHVAPSRSMITDALAQFLAFKRWVNVFLIVGPKPGDQLYAEAMRRSAKKFGLTIAADQPWTFGALARARSDSITQSDALVFTRGTDYDIMVVADEAADFGDYISYRTWDARLVAGTQGLVATSWHRAQDAWGSAQLQSRFVRASRRGMRPADYQAWAAVRAIGEAATRTKSSDPAAISSFMLGDTFQLAAFKGVPLSFRPWDRQMRQPMLLAQPAAIVSVSPQTGFLHQRTQLDTLGVDLPETACRLE